MTESTQKQFLRRRPPGLELKKLKATAHPPRKSENGGWAKDLWPIPLLPTPHAMQTDARVRCR